MNTLSAGAAQEIISPENSQFLFGYPHVPRYSTGIHDDLLSSALCLRQGGETVLFIGNDIIFVAKPSVERIRAAIQDATGIPGSSILISGTHTHSGPITVDYLSNESDPVVPTADADYVRLMEERIIRAGVRAAEDLRPAEVALTLADGTGVGTNRRDPSGPADLEVPVLQVRDRGTQKLMACMLICSMHPTVLHEDSKLVSGDFPGMTRQYLQRVLGDCVVVYHTGPEGNQSPRHVTKENTFAEAGRLGELLGAAVQLSLAGGVFLSDTPIWSRQEFLDLPLRTFPSVEVGETKLTRSIEKLETLRTSGASRQEIRTAECDWFGAEETLTLAKGARDGRMADYAKVSLPAEIQTLGVGPWTFVGWPGEFFVEYGLRVKSASPDTYIINLANGELQGYVVTEEAAREGGYEASNALFGPDSGEIFVRKTLELLLPAAADDR